MPALCFMLHPYYYAQNYAGIMYLTLSSTSNCTWQHCYLCPRKLAANYLLAIFISWVCVIISYFWFIFWSSVQIIIEKNKLLVFNNGIFNSDGKNLIIIGFNYKIFHRCCHMFLLNFDITIVVGFSHKIDFVETQTEKKVKFVLLHPLGEHVGMRKQRSGMNGYSCL